MNLKTVERDSCTLNGKTQNYTYDDADMLLDVKVSGTTGITYSGANTTLAYDFKGSRTCSITG